MSGPTQIVLELYERSYEVLDQALRKYVLEKEIIITKQKAGSVYWLRAKEGLHRAKQLQGDIMHQWLDGQRQVAVDRLKLAIIKSERRKKEHPP